MLVYIATIAAHTALYEAAADLEREVDAKIHPFAQRLMTATQLCGLTQRCHIFEREGDTHRFKGSSAVAGTKKVFASTLIFAFMPTCDRLNH